MPQATCSTFNDVARFLLDHDVNITDFIVRAIEGRFQPHEVALQAISEQLCHPQSLNRVASTSLATQKTREVMARIARNISAHELIDEMAGLIEKASGYHYNASHMTAEKILEFSREEIAMDLKDRCPHLWHLVQLLLNTPAAQSATRYLTECMDYLTELCLDSPGTSDDTNSEDLVDVTPIPVVRRTQGDKAHIHQSELSIVRGVSVISTLMQSSNARCNRLPTLVGLFTHSTHTPEKVVELLAHAGLSISPSSVNNMVLSISKNAITALKKGPSDQVKAVAFDNLDINFKTETPTVDYQGNMAHITTGAIVPVQGATHEDMRVSEQIWAKEDINPNNPPDSCVKPTHKNFVPLLAPMALPPDHPQSLESRMAWHVRKFLLLESVDTLQAKTKEKLRTNLGLPAVDLKRAAPVVKLEQQPVEAMPIDIGSNHGNVTAVENLMRQAGIDDAYLEEHVVLMHADLGAGDKVFHAKKSRSIEETPKNRLQYAQFIPGFFHIEMAIVNALWRIYLKHQDTSSGKPLDPHSIFYLCGLTRPREIKKLATGPDHRMTHHTVYYTLVALIVEAWSAAVKAKHGISLREWEPQWDEVVEMSREVVRNYVADLKFSPTHQVSSHSAGNTPDMANDTTKLFCRDTLLWVIVRHAARHGDVGCLEDVLSFWVLIWKHTGKHKYAEHITRFLLNLQKIWPTGFANIVRKNWLVNPTGKIGGFRGMDWVIELNNLMHKVIHAGGSSNRTLVNILKESPLIEIYRHLYEVIEKTFNMTKSTLHHPEPQMNNTLAML
ncbi:hypothetical protein FS749_009064 [Ceratobasidium sp. UAMH 11750]|nr:hypothetical protein FS749_009064 [Ceratobasidium sp. UAMH 11750]